MKKISFVAIDALYFDKGHDFRPEYRNLKQIIKQLGDVLLLA
jgi:ATP-dependent DNA helicase RecQ